MGWRISAPASPLPSGWAVGVRVAERIVSALRIIRLDAAAFALPLAARVLAYVHVARPRWFRHWVERLSQGGPRSARSCKNQDPQRG